MDRNSQKWSQKGYHSLPFAAKVCVWRSFEQFHSLNNRHRNFAHHSIPPCNLYKWKVFLTACRNMAAYCIIFLTVWNSWFRQQIPKILSLYKVSPSFRWNDKGKQVWKRKRNVLRRDDYFFFIIIPFKYTLLTKREVSMTGYMAKFLFLHFARLSKSPLFFPGWFCHETSSLVRSLQDLMHWSSSSLTFKNLWEVDL